MPSVSALLSHIPCVSMCAVLKFFGMIRGSGITKTFIGTPVLNNIDFKLGGSKKIALVGRNGAGKSTLIKIIAGVMEPDSGSLEIQGETIGYIPQEFDFPDVMLGEYLEGFLEHPWEFYRVEALADKLSFTNFDPYTDLGVLSEGQKMKVKLIEILLTNPTLLLIDEPTNHLDIDGILWFERYIQSLHQSVLMISHDRAFLNNTVHEVWELDQGKLYTFTGNYDDYKEAKLRLINKQAEEYKKFLKRKAKLERLLVEAHRRRISRKGGVKQVKSRIKREIEANKADAYVVQHLGRLNLGSGVTHSKLMVRFENVSKFYGDLKVFENLSFDIRGGEKVWLWGPNGAGKSTLVKLIVGEEFPTEGSITLGTSISIGYFAQKYVRVPPDARLLDYFMEETGYAYGASLSYLRKYLFEGDTLMQRFKDLSPGQRARFSFAVFAYRDYDMLILDEPSNNLDIETKDVMAEALHSYSGTLLLVSHDRFFVESVGITRMLNLREGLLFAY